MEKKARDIIWDYLDGKSSPEEQSWLHNRLAEDSSFREMFLESRLLHQRLQEIEPEMPSLRFSQNVMEKLPPIRDLAVTPLVSRKWLTTFAATIVGIVAFFLGSSYAFAPYSSRIQTGGKSNLLDLFYYLSDSVSTQTLLMAGTVGISLMSLLVLDRWLKTRFEH